MSNYTDFGVQARVIMLQKDIKISEVAEHLGVSSSYVGDIFRGARKGKKRKGEIAKFLGMEVNTNAAIR